jgi:hypothetical protein
MSDENEEVRHSSPEPEPPVSEFTEACCYNCGGDEFSWGDVVYTDPNSGTLAPVRFRPEQEKPPFWTPWKTEGLRTRRCLRCGNVQFFSANYVDQR